jgi:hypothetical protein
VFPKRRKNLTSRCGRLPGKKINFFGLHLLYSHSITRLLSTTYVVEPKFLHYSVHVLQSNIPMNILQSYVHISVKWYFFENLVVKSVRLNLFSLLGSSSSSSSVDASSFWCVVILFLNFTLNFFISFVIVATYKSACKTLLGIYHGAFTIAGRTFVLLCLLYFNVWIT